MRIGRYRITKRGYVVFGSLGIVIVCLLISGLAYVLNDPNPKTLKANETITNSQKNTAGSKATNSAGATNNAKQQTTATNAQTTLTKAQSNEILKQVVATIYFKPDSYEFDESDYPLLDPILETAVRFKEANITVFGHFNGVPGNKTTEFRTDLSQSRADVVVAYLVSKGIAPDKISTVNKGCTEPVNRDDSWQEIEKNRRVVVVFNPLK